MKTERAGFLGGMILVVAIGVSQMGCQPAGTPEDAADEAEESVGEAMESIAPSGESNTSASGRQSAPASRRQSAPPRRRSATLAEGTVLRIRTTSELTTDSHQAGESFTATLEEPLVEGNWVIAPQGSTVEGWVVEADEGGRVQGVARLSIQLAQLHTADGQVIEITTNPFTVEAETTKKDDATKIGIGAGLGTIIGAIAGGKKGAAIGAATGAGAGTGVVLATRGDAAVIGSESVLDFELQSPVTITESN